MKLVTAFKHLFIPHEHNDYKPHFFREVSVAIILTGSIFLLGFSAGSSYLIHKTVLGASVTANVLVDLTNESRLAFNESPLIRNPLLDKAANMKADDMSTIGYFAHNSPTGVTPWHWFKEAGYTFLYAGENLAINFIDANEVRQAWLASPTHRMNLLDVRFREIGMATVSGIYKDSPTIYVVQMFGTPAIARAETTAKATSATTTRELSVTPKVLAVKATTSTSLPEIKGETAENRPTPALEPIVTTKQFVVVKNIENVQEVVPVPTTVEKYSKWYEQILFGGSYYVGIALRFLLVLILVALVTMLVIEIRKQHWKHIVYGLSLLLIVSLCIIINRGLF